LGDAQSFGDFLLGQIVDKSKVQNGTFAGGQLSHMLGQGVAVGNRFQVVDGVRQ
jgi:hypothetical protein